MAYLDEYHCFACDSVTGHVDGECCKCEERKHVKLLKQWQAQTVDERLLDLLRRIESLESGPPRL